MILRWGFVSNVNVVAPSRAGGGSRRRKRWVGMATFAAAGPPITTTAGTAERLRSQLDQLHSEAEVTRSKANSARMRLLRLSEVAEKLQRQAAVDVQIGKENEARELLLQKQKVMQALEKSKGRIELLDQLSVKLNEAISLKEAQLIENISLHTEEDTEETNQPIHIISPRAGVDEDSKEGEVVDSSGLKLNEITGLESQNCHADIPMENLQPMDDRATRIGILDEDDGKIRSLRGITSYNNFLEHVDGQLREIETDLLTILRLSTLVAENEQMQGNLKVQSTLHILDDVCSIRRRIASIIQARNGDN